MENIQDAIAMCWCWVVTFRILEKSKLVDSGRLGRKIENLKVV